MADLAEIKRASIGTEYRENETSSWHEASVGQILLNGYQTKNTEDDNYQVALFGDAEIAFGVLVDVSLSDISGTVKYKNSAGEWITADSECDVSATSVATEPGGGVYILCSGKGAYRPPVWN